MEKAVLVNITLKESKRHVLEKPREKTFSEEEKKREFIKLVESAGCEVLDVVQVNLARPTAAIYIGSGKAEEIGIVAREQKADVVIFNSPLSSTQQRNLEDILTIKVLDRIQLILDIFARHAQSADGQLQVELAQLQYLLPRLKGKGIILSRLGGGVGTRGPGERKLEIDRRRITDRVTMLEHELKNLNVHRDVMRKKKDTTGIPTISLVGYTSVGKSTLMNNLTAAHQRTSGGYFTTLDTIHRSLEFPSGQKAVLTDTVGFMHDLPPYLIESFKTTLRELEYSSLLVHVIDASSEYAQAQAEAVMAILKELKIDERPLLMVFNKIDLCEDTAKDTMERLQQTFPQGIFISALAGMHIDVLLMRIEQMVFKQQIRATITIPQKHAGVFHLIHENARIENIEYQKDTAIFSVIIEEIPLQKLLKALDKKATVNMPR